MPVNPFSSLQKANRLNLTPKDKSDIKNHQTEKPTGEYFNLPGYLMGDFKVAFFSCKGTSETD